MNYKKLNYIVVGILVSFFLILAYISSYIPYDYLIINEYTQIPMYDYTWTLLWVICAIIIIIIGFYVNRRINLK